MKRTVCVLLALALCLPLLAACGEPGSTRGVQLAPGASERFSEADVRSAMDCAMARFRKEFGGCTLTRLAYSEAYLESYPTSRNGSARMMPCGSDTVRII